MGESRSATVAVTGVTGFVGGHIARFLASSGWRVRGLVRRMPVTEILGPTRIDAVLGDLEDELRLRELVRGADAIVHVAGLVRARSRQEFFKVNARAVTGLVDVVRREAPAARLTLISSLAAREPQISAYAASKHAGELALKERGDGLAWTIVRPPAVYGPGDMATGPLFKWIGKGICPQLGPRQARFSLIHSADLAVAIGRVLDSPRALQRTFELCDGRPGGYTWQSLAEIAAMSLKTTVRRIRVPRGLLLAAGIVAEICSWGSSRPLIMSRDKVKELTHCDWVCSNAAIEAATGWKPSIPLETGIRELLTGGQLSH